MPNQIHNTARNNGLRLKWQAKSATLPAPIRAAGFTLIELSIVLVIIGLIVGGVLVGQDLIQAAKMRNVQSKIQSFDAAVLTFRLKYNSLPGDTKNAYQFFSGSIGCTNELADPTGTGCNGNGDRLIGRRFEMLRMFQQLEASGLINEAIEMHSSITDIRAAGTLSPPSGALPYGPDDIVFGLKCGEKNGAAFLICDPSMDFNGHGYRVSSYSSGTTDPFSHSSFSGTPLTPIQAFKWDQKFDDGISITGNIRVGPGGSPASSCVKVTDQTYRTANSAFKDEKNCWMNIKAPF